ncbi:hypothetical protein ACA910_001896 [Epithemia clementina (nom. ined.)]
MCLHTSSSPTLPTPAPCTSSSLPSSNSQENAATDPRDCPRHRVLVVGAGPSGLAAVEELLAVGDLEVVAVDGRSEIGVAPEQCHI